MNNSSICVYACKDPMLWEYLRCHAWFGGTQCLFVSPALAALVDSLLFLKQTLERAQTHTQIEDYPPSTQRLLL